MSEIKLLSCITLKNSVYALAYFYATKTDHTARMWSMKGTAIIL